MQRSQLDEKNRLDKERQTLLKETIKKRIIRLHKTGSMVKKLFIGNAKKTIIANLK